MTEFIREARGGVGGLFDQKGHRLNHKRHLLLVSCLLHRHKITGRSFCEDCISQWFAKQDLLKRNALSATRHMFGCNFTFNLGGMGRLIEICNKYVETNSPGTNPIKQTWVSDKPQLSLICKLPKVNHLFSFLQSMKYALCCKHWLPDDKEQFTI